jgi:hypothetical protein
MSRVMTKPTSWVCHQHMDLDQPAHPRSLIRIHAVRLPTLLQVEKLIATSVDPDQDPCWFANALCWFCCDAAHLSLSKFFSWLIFLKYFG